jgi:heat shock protein HtpX
MTDQPFLVNTDFQKAIRKNKRNCCYLLLALYLILIILGYLIGAYLEIYFSDYNNYNSQFDASLDNNIVFNLSRTGLTAAFIALCIGIVWSGIAVLSGSRLLLFSAGATKIEPDDKDYNMLRNVIQEMALAAGLPVPRIYVMETEALNAFATGMSPNSAAVAITRGLLNQLNRDELQGVMAHEMGHIVNYDIRYQTLVSIIVGLIVLLSDLATRMIFYSHRGSARSNSNSKKGNTAGIILIVLLAFSIIAPIAALILQMSVSRQREFLADATSVKLTRDPTGLISALQKLDASAAPFDGASKANQNLFIVNPFRRVAKAKSSLLATHPSIEDRIARLKNLE